MHLRTSRQIAVSAVTALITIAAAGSAYAGETAATVGADAAPIAGADLAGDSTAESTDEDVWAQASKSLVASDEQTTVGTTARATSASACTRQTWTDLADAGAMDIRAYGHDVDCEQREVLFETWTEWFSVDDFESYVIMLDSDNDPGTGWNGIERAAMVTQAPTLSDYGTVYTVTGVPCVFRRGAPYRVCPGNGG